MSKTETSSRVSGPLYVFDLPQDILDALQPRQLQIPENGSQVLTTKDAPEYTVKDKPVDSKLLAIEGSFVCALTGASFQDLGALREHYRTDWYKYNVKLKAQGRPTGVSEEDFLEMVDALSGSLSGSASSSSSNSHSSSDSLDAVSRVLSKHRIGDRTEAMETTQPRTGAKSSLLWYEAPALYPDTQYGIYRAAIRLPKGIDDSQALMELRKAQLSPADLSTKSRDVSEGRKWTLLMFGGGHFAGMVVSLVPTFKSRGKGKDREREVVVLQQKTFHRYTTRRKQGGSQSAHDSGSGKAKSAGAQIRRHNETALTEEVQDILRSWSSDVKGSELVFLRCSKTNHSTFFDFDGTPLQRRDDRIRGFSFPTRRPTLKELLRAFSELTNVKMSHLSQDALAKLDSLYLASIKPTATPKPSAPKVTIAKVQPVKRTKEEEVNRDRWMRCIDMLRKGKVEVLSAFLEKHEADFANTGGLFNESWGALPTWMDDCRTTPTFLHVASAADQAEMVRWLLEDKHANPTLEASILNPTSEAKEQIDARPAMTPYELAPSRSTRNVFRLLTTTHPEWWDWTGNGPSGARIPSGLNEEKEEERERKNKERRTRLREKMKEREQEKEAKALSLGNNTSDDKIVEAAGNLPAVTQIPTNFIDRGKHRLGGGPPRALVEKNVRGAGLTEEQNMRIQREQRARAAEARMAKSSG